MLELAGDATSYDDIRQIAYENTSQQTGQMIVPMLRTLLRLWGTTPATIFKNMSSVVSVQVKGTKLIYVAETDTSGVMEIDPSRVCNPYVYAGWEGVFLFAYEVSGVKGDVSRTVITEGGRYGKCALRWTPANQ
jgi:hypothetical protein